MTPSLGRSRWQTIVVMGHFVVTCTSFWIAWLLRFDFTIPATEVPVFYRGLVVALAAKLPAFYLMKLHLEWWRYTGFTDLIRLLKANVLASAVFTVSVYALVGEAFPRSICLLDLLVCFMVSAGLRLAARLHFEVAAHSSRRDEKGLLIYGAGVAGITLAREIRANPSLGYRIIGFLDDDPKKHGATLIGLPVLGGGGDAAEIVEIQHSRGQSVDEIVVTMPSATGRQIRDAVACGRTAGVSCRMVPGLGELISGRTPVSNMREISVTDLLGRDPVRLDLESVRRAITGRSVLVTGAAGSIGSELCNQLARLNPRRLVALDQAESELFRLEADLRSKSPELELFTEIGDITDSRRLDEVMASQEIDSIFHAAAYKHVPLMERHVCEAVRNNVLGTWNVVQAAWRANVSHFLLISTDKAVNPTSIMGLTKRVAELIVMAKRSTDTLRHGTSFVCVRFGNVLVSNGSVVPIFERQIAAGGPVTVTHPEVRRYFMTVQEAVQLVLQASTMGTGSQIFVLDMGKLVRILDLARKMITLAGFVPDEDIEIRFTGLRPGEKLFEEISLQRENMLPTRHEKIWLFQSSPVPMQVLAPWIAELKHLVASRDDEAVIGHLKRLVPEYQPSSEAGLAGVFSESEAPHHYQAIRQAWNDENDRYVATSASSTRR